MQPEHTRAEIGRSFVRFAVTLTACMGGFCPIREKCARYHAARRREPSERLCSPGERDAWLPIDVITQPPTTEETSA